MKLIADEVCANSHMTSLCDNIMFLMTGPESNQLNVVSCRIVVQLNRMPLLKAASIQTRTPVYLAHVPAGTSTQNILHWAQMVRSGQLQEYDYGSKKTNVEHYGQVCY